MLGVINTAVSGLNAQSQKLQTAASNIANASSTGSLSADGRQAYIPQDVDITSTVDGNVRAELRPRSPATTTLFEPNSPFANSDGLIASPNVNIQEELITSLQAENAYKANAQLIPIAKELSETLLDIFE